MATVDVCPQCGAPTPPRVVAMQFEWRRCGRCGHRYRVTVGRPPATVLLAPGVTTATDLAFWETPDWGDAANLKDAGAEPFWTRGPKYPTPGDIDPDKERRAALVALSRATVRAGASVEADIWAGRIPRPAPPTFWRRLIRYVVSKIA